MKPLPLQRLPDEPVGLWLSLFALLLIFAGPLIGQGMSPSRATTLSSDLACGQHQTSPTTDHDKQDREPCGYCSLWFQSPVLATPQVQVSSARLAGVVFESAHAAAQLSWAPIFPGARSRAPPV